MVTIRSKLTLEELEVVARARNFALTHIRNTPISRYVVRSTRLFRVFKKRNRFEEVFVWSEDDEYVFSEGYEEFRILKSTFARFALREGE